MTLTKPHLPYNLSIKFITRNIITNHNKTNKNFGIKPYKGVVGTNTNYKIVTPNRTQY